MVFYKFYIYKFFKVPPSHYLFSFYVSVLDSEMNNEITLFCHFRILDSLLNIKRMNETQIHRSITDLPPTDPDLNIWVYGGIINDTAF